MIRVRVSSPGMDPVEVRGSTLVSALRELRTRVSNRLADFDRPEAGRQVCVEVDELLEAQRLLVHLDGSTQEIMARAVRAHRLADQGRLS